MSVNQKKLDSTCSIYCFPRNLLSIKEKLRNKHNNGFRLEFLASWGEFRNGKGASKYEKMDYYCR